MDFSKHTFRCSSLGDLMTDSKGKSNLDLYNESTEKLEIAQSQLLEATSKLKEGKDLPKAYINLQEKVRKLFEENSQLKEFSHIHKLSETCISKLCDIYIFEKFGREYKTSSNYTEKGNDVEEKSITLLSDLDGDFYVKNKERKFNEWINGECDLVKEDAIEDVKSSWSLKTHIKKIIEGVNKGYWWQGQGYMWLWSKEKYILSHVLLDTPEPILKDEKRKLLWQMGTDLEDSYEYKKACEELMLDLTFPDLEPNERVHRQGFKFIPEIQEKIIKRVESCRIWLNEFDAMLDQKKLIITTPVFEDISFLKDEKEQKDTTINISINELSVIGSDKDKEKIIEEAVVEILKETVTGEEKIEIEEEEQDNIEPEPEQDYTKSIIEEINNCKDELSVREIYKKYKTQYDTIPEIKQALITKRDSFKKVEAPKPATTPEPKPKAAPAPIPAPVAKPKEEPKKEDNLSEEIKKKVSSFTDPSEIKVYCRSTPEIMNCIKSDKSLLEFINKTGTELSEKLKQKTNIDDL